MLFKILLKDETHLMKLKEGQTFEDFRNYVLTAFKKLPSAYHIVYIDEDGDSINLDNQHDFDSLLELGLAKVNVQIIGLPMPAEETNFNTKLKQCRSERNSYQTSTGKISAQKSPSEAMEKPNQQKNKDWERKQEEKLTNVLQKSSLIQIDQNQSFKGQVKTETKEIEVKNIWLLEDTKQNKNQKRGLFVQEIVSQKKEMGMNQKKEKNNSKQEFNCQKNVQPRNEFQKSRVHEPVEKRGGQVEDKQEQAQKQDPKDNFIHDDIACDICGVIPIIGNRYKCSVCGDFDLCQACEQDASHDHALIKIRYRDQPFERQNKSLSTVSMVGKTLMSSGRVIMNGVGQIYKLIFKSNENQKLIRQDQKKEQAVKMEIGVMPMRIESKYLKLKENEKKGAKKQLSEQDIQLESANYLHSILGVDFNRCYTFTKKYPKLNKQELIVQYFENVKQI